MTQQELLDLINQFIVTNGNNEITANVLNPILKDMVNQPNLLIGVLSQLNTADQTNLVNAINEVYNLIGDVTDVGVRLHQGTSDPNVTPPPQYNIADFYIQKDLSNNPIQLWQWNGVIWVGSFQIEDNDYHTDFPYSGSQIFTILENVKGISVFINQGFQLKSNYNRISQTQVQITSPLEDGDIISIVGVRI